MGTLRRLGVFCCAVIACVALAPPASAAPVLAVTVDRARLQADPRLVALSGTYTCGPFAPGGDHGVVDLSLLQGSNPPPGGIGYVYLMVCDGSVRSWTVVVETFGQPFVRGSATALAGGYGCDVNGGAGCATVDHRTRVRIR